MSLRLRSSEGHQGRFRETCRRRGVSAETAPTTLAGGQEVTVVDGHAEAERRTTG
jgi:hypothetical protein